MIGSLICGIPGCVTFEKKNLCNFVDIFAEIININESR
jgi:hypothetical protein